MQARDTQFTETKEIDPMTIPADKNPAAPPTSTTWDIDPAASWVEFSTRMRLMFLANVKVKGHFSDVQGTFIGDEQKPTNANVQVTIGSSSLDTRSAARDKHLRSADFFDVEHYPQLTFTSRRIEALDPAHGQYRVAGLLTIRDVTREVSLDAWYTSQPGAVLRHTVNLTTDLDRRDFGLVWSRPMQKIADDVTITLHIELVPAASPV
jgi:polyisoprenoid-binding protein YceI